MTDETSLGARWLTANVLGSVTAGAVTLAGDGVKYGALTTVDETIRVAFMAIVAAMSFATLAYFIGTVLRSRLPAMSLRTWVAAHAAVGLVTGGFSEWLGPSDEPMTAEDLAEWIGIALMIMGLAAAVLAGIGAFHALLLRSAARGLGRWIGCSALAGLAAVLFMPLLMVETQTGMRYSLMLEACAILFGIIWAFAMLPALRRLTPKI